MGQFTKLDKAPIAPVYGQEMPNKSVELGNVIVEYDVSGKTYGGNAKATMRFVPDDRLSFEVPVESGTFVGLAMFEDGKWDGKLKLTGRGVILDALCRRVRSDEGGSRVVVFEPRASGVVVTPASDVVASATFHLFNFPDFVGPDDCILTFGEPPLQGAKRCGQVILKADGWVVTVAATERTGDCTNALKEEGGYIITHMDSIVREDGSAFGTDDLIDMLNCVQYFLSFALGRWAGVALPIGVDAQGKIVFEEWGMRMTADGSWGGSSSWFDSHHGELLAQVFPGFVELRSSPVWRRALSEALYWYFGACDRRIGIGVDTGLILAQTALELLAWTHCVQDRKMVSPGAFKQRGLAAADRLRILVSSLGIPLAIPDCLSALHAKKGRKWDDSMDAITGIRNSLVHPDRRDQVIHETYYEAWKLALWYLDLVLLRLCRHCGKYANRLASRWVGEVESVPWI
jgi:hypothetical protein